MVDAHLLDTVIAALALDVSEAVLVHSAGQEMAAAIAARSLESRGIFPIPFRLANDFGLDDLRAVFVQLGDDWQLHYTGGPHGLAPLLVRAGMERGLAASNASILDEERRRLRFDDGRDVRLSEALHGPVITIDNVLELANLQRRGGDRLRPDEDAVVAASEWGIAQRGAPRRRLARLRPDEVTDGWARENLPTIVADRVIAAGPALRSSWRHYLAGTWLEDLTALAVDKAAASLRTTRQTEAGVAVRPPEGPGFEVDVLAVIGHRPHVISCTCQDDEAGVRAKAYEAERRAWQLGGPIVRPALVAPVTRLAHTIRGHFLEPLELHRSTELEVFDRDDIRSWVTALQKGERIERVERWLAEGLGLEA